MDSTLPWKSHSSFLRYYMKPYWKSLLAASISSICLGFLSTMIVSLVGPSIQILNETNLQLQIKVIDLLGPKIGFYVSKFTHQESFSVETLLQWLPIFLFATASLKAFFYITQSYIWERTGELISKDLRDDTFREYVNQNLSSKKTEAGRRYEANLSSTLTTDVKMIKEYLVHFYGGFPREVLQMLFLTLMLFALSPKLLLMFSIFTLPIAYVIKRLGKKLKKRAKQALDNYSILTEWLQQRLLGCETIKQYKMELHEVEEFEKLTENVFKRFLKAAQIKARTSPILEMISIFALTGVLIIALAAIERHEISGSVAISFFTSLALLAQSGNLVGRYMNSNREGAAAVDRVCSLGSYLKSNPKFPFKHKKIFHSSDDTTIHCRHISHFYPKTNKPALKDFSFKFCKQKIYCISGRSGSGKSTLFSILLDLIEPSEGEVLISSEHKSTIGYMPQNNLLLSSTLAKNIAYPETTYDEDKIWQALKKVDLDQFFHEKQLGIHESIETTGTGLSGGQIQRILLSRIFYHDYKIILVDECTSALDPEIEAVIFEGLKNLKKEGRTIIMIAHRTSAMNIADEILLLNDGILVSS